MSSNSFSSVQSVFGTAGQKTVQQMSDALTSQSLSLQYNTKTRIFTILGSSDKNRDSIQSIFNQNYHVWVPQLLKETNKKGNLMLKLTTLVDPIMEQTMKTCNTALLGFIWQWLEEELPD